MDAGPDDTALGFPVYGVSALHLRAAVSELGMGGSVALTPLLGGMSNKLFLARSKAGASMVVRLLNPLLDDIVDRGRELRIMRRLGAAGVSPRVLGVAHAPAAAAAAAADARCVAVRGEEHLEGRTLVVGDLRAGVPAAAFAHPLVRMHAEAVRPAPGDEAGADAVAWLDQAAPVFDEHVDGYLAGMAAARAAAGGRCCCAAVADGALLAQPALARERLCRLLHVIDWAGEARFMKGLLAARGGPLVLCHNDLQANNWILVGPPPVVPEAAVSPAPSPTADAAAASSSLAMPSDGVYARRVGRRLDEAELRSGRLGSALSTRTADSGGSSRRASPTRFRGAAGAGAGGAAVGAGAPAVAPPPSAHDLRIIDLEYAGLNYRAFDLGNLSCEFTFDYLLPVYPGFTFEKSEYPANEQQSELFEAYARGWRAEAARRPWIAAADASAGTRARARAAEALASVPEDSAAAAERWARTSTSPAAVDAVVGRSSSGGGGVAQPGAAAGPPDSDDLVRRLVVEARLGMLASNFYWAAWAAVMAEGRAAAAPAATTVFDYAAYGLVRAREFSRLKKQLLSLDDGAAAEAEAAAAAGEAAAAAAAATLAADC